MNTVIRKLHRLFIWAIVVVGCVSVAPRTARADTLDAVLTILKAVPDVGTDVSLIDSGRKLFTCIADGNDILECRNQHGDACADLNNAIGFDGSLPPWLDEAIQVYEDVKNRNWGSLIVDVGLSAACIAIEVVGGDDLQALCGVLGEVIQLAEDIVQDVAKFIGWLVDGLKDLWCDTLGSIFGGCDSSDAPPDVFLFAAVLANRVPEGLPTVWQGGQARKDQARANARSWAAAFVAGSGMMKTMFSQGDIDSAANIYMSALETLWKGKFVECYTSDDPHGVRLERVSISTSAGIEALALGKYIMHEYSVDPNGTVYAYGGNECSQMQNLAAWGSASCLFTASGWDGWIADHAADAASMKLLGADKWCGTYSTKIIEILQHLYDVDQFNKVCHDTQTGQRRCVTPQEYSDCKAKAAKAKVDSSRCLMDLSAICPRASGTSSGKLVCADWPQYTTCTAGAALAKLDPSQCTLDPAIVCPLNASDGKYYCTSVDSHSECQSAATSVGKAPNLCGYNVCVAGEADNKLIMNWLQCTSKNPNPPPAAMPKGQQCKPWTITCPRKIQQYNCKALSSPELVECILIEDPAYARTAAEVANAVREMNRQFPGANATVALDPLATGGDPLVVTVPDPQAWQNVSATDWKVSPRFTYQRGAVPYNPNGVSKPIVTTVQQKLPAPKAPALTTPGSLNDQARVGAAVQSLGKKDPLLVNPDTGMDTHVAPTVTTKPVQNKGAVKPGAAMKQ